MVKVTKEPLPVTQDGFWQLPIADRDLLWAALGVSEMSGKKLLEHIDGQSLKVGARTFIFPRALAQAFSALPAGGLDEN